MIRTVIFTHSLRSCDTITIFSVDISAAHRSIRKKNSGRIRLEKQGKKKRQSQSASNIFPRDAASITCVPSRRISFVMRYFQNNSRRNVRVKFILRQENDLLNLSRKWTIYSCVRLYASTLLVPTHLRRFKETSTIRPDRSQEERWSYTYPKEEVSYAPLNLLARFRKNAPCCK